MIDQFKLQRFVALMDANEMGITSDDRAERMKLGLEIVMDLVREYNQMRADMAEMLNLLDRSHVGPGDIVQKRLNAENHVRGMLMRALGMVNFDENGRMMDAITGQSVGDEKVWKS